MLPCKPKRANVSLSQMTYTTAGLRCGELCGLQVGDIDLKSRTLRVRHSVNRGRTDRGHVRIADTKTRSSIRSVLIPDGLIPVIGDHLRQHCDWTDPDAMVFPPRRVKIMSQTTLEGQFRKAREKAGRPDLTFKSLRASHATLLMLRGGSYGRAGALQREGRHQALPAHRRSAPESSCQPTRR